MRLYTALGRWFGQFTMRIFKIRLFERFFMSLLSGFEQIVRDNEPLAMHTWLQVGGGAKYFAEPENPEQLIELIRRCHQDGVQARVLGRGSNILVRDEGFKGMVLHLYAPAFANIKIEGRSVTAGGGACWAALLPAPCIGA